MRKPRLKPRQRLGKYRIARHLATGGFAEVYAAQDTVEGIKVALKIPHGHLIDNNALDDFRKEVRVTARLDHPNVLPIKNATFIEELFVIAYPLGERTLADRLQSRLSAKRALTYADQLIAAIAHAHQHRIMHCDIKPENIILFKEDRLRLTDFGLAKVALYTIEASGAGTVGYMSPEQAMGKPSFRSDIFSAGLVIYQMFTASLPQWPFDWPPDGYDRLKRKVHPDLIDLLQRTMTLDPRRRVHSGVELSNLFQRIKPRALSTKQRRRRRNGDSHGRWKEIRRREYLRRFKRILGLREHCPRCDGPIAEIMRACPWCGRHFEKFRGESSFPKQCPRCSRGVKLDWKYCAWCHGPAIQEPDAKEYSDRRYIGRCANPSCDRKQLMPFMRYCPWCSRKVRRPWAVPESKERCKSCGWGVLKEFWNSCPWCGTAIRKTL